MFNVRVQPYGYDRPTFFFLSTDARSTDLFSFSLFLHCLAACSASLGLWATCPPNSVFNYQKYPLSSNSSPFRSALWSHSAALSAFPSWPPTSVVIKYLSSGSTAHSFANKLANHLFSGQRCHSIPSPLSSLLRTLLSFFHFLHFA